MENRWLLSAHTIAWKCVRQICFSDLVLSLFHRAHSYICSAGILFRLTVQTMSTLHTARVTLSTDAMQYHLFFIARRRRRKVNKSIFAASLWFVTISECYFVCAHNSNRKNGSYVHVTCDALHGCVWVTRFMGASMWGREAMNMNAADETERTKHALQINVFVFLRLIICVQNDFKGIQCHNDNNTAVVWLCTIQWEIDQTSWRRFGKRSSKCVPERRRTFGISLPFRIVVDVQPYGNWICVASSVVAARAAPDKKILIKRIFAF